MLSVLAQAASSTPDITPGQPESAGMVRTTMFLGIAFTEALALFGFVLAFIISG